MTLTDIARQVAEHLARMERTPSANTAGPEGRYRFFRSYAWRAGSRVMVRYIGYQPAHSLTRAAAEAYLAWLDAGNNGKHWEAQEPVAW